MRRVSVVGMSGSGKSTLARILSTRLGVPYLELDAVKHQPGWRPLPDGEFIEEVDRATARPGWVIDGNYQQVVIEGPVWQRADTVVWIDLPRRAVMRSVIARTWRRFLTREVLWNGNREPLSNFYSLNPEYNVILWAWLNYDEMVQRYLYAMTDPRWQELDFIRLGSRVEVQRWLETIG